MSEGAEWFIALEPIKVGELCSIIISEAESSILLEDVLFGDVWFCSGQVAKAYSGHVNMKTWGSSKFYDMLVFD